MTNEEAIAANAELVRQTFQAQELDFDERSVEWLDGFIERNRHNWDDATKEKLGGMLGSFLGECIRSNYGGEWLMTENGLAVSFDETNAAFPFNKVNKQIENGREDSISSFYSTLGTLRTIKYAE